MSSKTDGHVMSVNEYASFHRVHAAMTGKAFRALVDKDFLVERRGIGMFVEAEARVLLEKEHRSRFADDMVAPLLARCRRLSAERRERAHS